MISTLPPSDEGGVERSETEGETITTPHSASQTAPLTRGADRE